MSQLPTDVREYLDQLTARVRACIGGDLVGMGLFGSAALGDFDPQRSDLDVQAVALNLNTGAGLVSAAEHDPADRPRFWFTIDVAIGREHGVALAGPRSRDVFPPQPPPRIRAALAQSLAWHLEHEPASPGALLAACRGLAWAADGRWRSKRDAARWAALTLQSVAR